MGPCMLCHRVHCNIVARLTLEEYALSLSAGELFPNLAHCTVSEPLMRTNRVHSMRFLIFASAFSGLWTYTISRGTTSRSMRSNLRCRDKRPLSSSTQRRPEPGEHLSPRQ